MAGWLGRKLQCCNYPFLTGNLSIVMPECSFLDFLVGRKSVFLRKTVKQHPALCRAGVRGSSVSESNFIELVWNLFPKALMSAGLILLTGCYENKKNKKSI